jgi:hypothetical protein
MLENLSTHFGVNVRARASASSLRSISKQSTEHDHFNMATHYQRAMTVERTRAQQLAELDTEVERRRPEVEDRVRDGFQAAKAEMNEVYESSKVKSKNRHALPIRPFMRTIISRPTTRT